MIFREDIKIVFCEKLKYNGIIWKFAIQTRWFSEKKLQTGFTEITLTISSHSSAFQLDSNFVRCKRASSLVAAMLWLSLVFLFISLFLDDVLFHNTN